MEDLGWPSAESWYSVHPTGHQTVCECEVGVERNRVRPSESYIANIERNTFDAIEIKRSNVINCGSSLLVTSKSATKRQNCIAFQMNAKVLKAIQSAKLDSKILKIYAVYLGICFHSFWTPVKAVMGSTVSCFNWDFVQNFVSTNIWNSVLDVFITFIFWCIIRACYEQLHQKLTSFLLIQTIALLCVTR